MRFPVPQFIDVEDKWFGAFTLKQAAYLAGGVGLAAVLLLRGGIFAGVLIGVPIALFAFALAFVKINNRPFALVVYAALFYTIRTKLYLWRKTPRARSAHRAQQESHHTKKLTRTAAAPKITRSRLKELAWSLDTRSDTEQST